MAALLVEAQDLNHDGVSRERLRKGRWWPGFQVSVSDRSQYPLPSQITVASSDNVTELVMIDLL